MAKKENKGAKVVPVGDHDVYPWPDGIPHDTFARLIAILQGDSATIEDAHRLWHIIGFALSQFDPHDPIVFEGKPLTKKKAAELLLEAYPAGEIAPGVKAAGLKGMPWLAIIGLVITILKHLLT